ncbi:hypothetical protein QM467_01695 [Rhodoblastus sp. 17X3]|uniref:hypothetical protein n=1 Tax=Rhodoblastus sp. 17X3 TaxID=3047026 RepID=UPI0024B66120|nr:hypothetical protein [Rhodoblastus sp. 17X3]MDI9846765.1 hypothetical protein [Rhodoblastus sp. 17X3]
MNELNGRMVACQILLTGLIARVANETRDPIGFLSDFRDEIQAVIQGVRIAGHQDSEPIRLQALKAVDEMFSLMKAPSAD